MDILYNPLVSVVVITYNSEKYILETLESIYNQTYENIELIISDDASNDDTLNLCKNWINNFGHRFKNISIVTTNINTGISSNCNRGIKITKGEWIKLIAGDDILLINCISSNVNFLLNNKKACFIFSDVDFINEKSKSIESPKWYNTKYQHFFTLDSNLQHKELVLNGNFVLAPTSFIKQQVLLNLEGFDDRIPMQEDYALWIKATLNHYRLYFNPTKTIAYRIHSNSMTNSYSYKYRVSVFINFKYYRSKYVFLYNYSLWYYLYISYFTDAKKNKLYKLLKLTSTKFIFNFLTKK